MLKAKLAIGLASLGFYGLRNKRLKMVPRVKFKGLLLSFAKTSRKPNVCALLCLVLFVCLSAFVFSRFFTSIRQRAAVANRKSNDSFSGAFLLLTTDGKSFCWTWLWVA